MKKLIIFLVLLIPMSSYADLKLYCIPSENSSCIDQIENVLTLLKCDLEKSSISCDKTGMNDYNMDYCEVTNVKNCEAAIPPLSGFSDGTRICHKGTKVDIAKFNKNISLTTKVGFVYFTYSTEICLMR